MKEKFINKDNVILARKEIMACEKKKDELILEYEPKYEDITNDVIVDKKVKTKNPEFICNFNTIDKTGNKIIYTKENAKFRKANLTADERKVITRLREDLGWNMNLLREIEKPDAINVPDIERLGNISDDYYEIKSIYKSESKNSQLKKVQRCFDEAKNQAHKVILNIDTIDCDLSNEMALEQIEKLLNRKKYNSIYEEVILLGKEKYLKYFKRI